MKNKRKRENTKVDRGRAAEALKGGGSGSEQSFDNKIKENGFSSLCFGGLSSQLFFFRFLHTTMDKSGFRNRFYNKYSSSACGLLVNIIIARLFGNNVLICIYNAYSLDSNAIAVLVDNYHSYF